MSQRPMNDFEKNSFNLDLNQQINISYSLRLKYKQKIYHSKDFKVNSSKKCSYVVKLKNYDKIYYGEILYFLELEEKFFLVVNLFVLDKSPIFSSNANIKNTILNENIFKEMKNDFDNFTNSGIFARYYKFVHISDQLLLISADDILNYCIVAQTTDDKYIIVEYFDLDHD